MDLDADSSGFMELKQDDEPTLDPYIPSEQDDDSGRSTPCSLSSSEEWFDADPELPASLSSGATAVDVFLPSPSASVTNMSDEPTDVEEEALLDAGDKMHDIMSSNKSIIMQVLSQIRIGMDLTRFALPVFFLEKRSLLQMYADFFTHPDMLASITDVSDAKSRMTEVVRWFLLSVSASRKGVEPKKPYNPVLGETFHCYWDLPIEEHISDTHQYQDAVKSGPVPYAGTTSLTFVAEQVSHHPPVSAFYAECPAKRMYVNGTVCTKTKFLGLSVKAQNNGSVRIYFMDHDEEYVANLPNGYVRSILTTPWFEFGGECTISCAKSGYVANVEFHPKPFRGGKRHKVTIETKHTSENKASLKMEGEWNNVIYTIPQSSDQSREVFMDSAKSPKIHKKFKTLSAVKPSDSRAVWRNVTEAMLQGDSEAASEAKHTVEEKQRTEVKERQRTETEWQQKLFTSNGTGDAHHDTWFYNSPLSERLSRS